jgi:hypothetical protein
MTDPKRSIALVMSIPTDDVGDGLCGAAWVCDLHFRQAAKHVVGVAKAVAAFVPADDVFARYVAELRGHTHRCTLTEPLRCIFSENSPTKFHIGMAMLFEAPKHPKMLKRICHLYESERCFSRHGGT